MQITKRMEYKYLISYKDYYKLKPLLESILHTDQYAQEGAYPITSIYLDDLYHSGAMDKAFGNQYHKKYRLRYYNDPNKMKLELKEKEGNETQKTSTWVSPELSNAIQTIDLNILHNHFDDPLIRRYTLDALRYHYQPKASILYEREAFVDATQNLRITFDHRLQASPVHPDHDYTFLNMTLHSHLILEIKYEHYLPKEIKHLFHNAKLNQLSVSKYFLGYQHITP